MIEIFLRNIEKAAALHDISNLEDLINQILLITQIPKVELASGLEFQRIRNNYRGEIFFSESEISFRQDLQNIHEFGRCNFPNSSKFYCSLSSKYIKEIRVINVLETNKIFRENHTIHKRQIFTSGQWLCRQPLIVGIFPFNKYARGTNSEVSLHASKYETILNSFDKVDRENATKILPFISYYLGRRRINSHWDYLISTFFCELIFSRHNLDGILYPSVRAGFKAYNLVLQPYATSKLHFLKAAMFELILNNKRAFIDNVADGEIGHENKIFWNQLKRTSDKELSRLLK